MCRYVMGEIQFQNGQTDRGTFALVRAATSQLKTRRGWCPRAGSG